METYHQKAQKWVRILGKIFTIEAIFLSGSLATGKATQNSDIDFFIITRRGTIWFTRFWVFLLLARRRELSKLHDHAGKICPNHFITSDHLELQEKNAYSAEMFSQNIPLYDTEDWFEAFAKANVWVEDFGYEFQLPVTSYPLPGRRAFPLTIHYLPFAFFARLTEPLFKYFQKRRIERSQAFQKSEHGFVLTDQELRFHPVLKSKL